MTPVFTYARSSHELAMLAQQLRNDPRLQEVQQRVGTVIHSSYANVQLAHHYQSGTHAVSKIVWQTMASYLLARWFGDAHAPISTSEASWTGLLSVINSNWDEDVVQACGIPLHHLPRLVDVDQYVTGRLSDEYKHRWPELQTARVHYGLGDGAAANLGSQCDQPGRVAVTIGTSAAARVILPTSTASCLAIPKGLWCYRVDSERLLLGGALTDGGSAIAWFKDTYRVSDLEFRAMEQEVEQQLRMRQPSKVFALTFFGGERSPGYLDHATASFHGMKRSTTRTDLLRAIMEGVCFRLKEILLRIEDSMLQATGREEASGVCLVVSGGALEQSKLWRFMLCQISDKTVYTLRSATELTSLGVGRLILSKLAFATDHATSNDVELVVDSEPQPHITSMYKEAFSVHQHLYFQSWQSPCRV